MFGSSNWSDCSCPICGKRGVTRENGSYYEARGWLHICKTTPRHKEYYFKTKSQKQQQGVNHVV